MIVPLFITSAETGEPLAGVLASFAFFKRRNADGTITDLPDPTVNDKGAGGYDFVVADELVPAGSMLLYVVDCTAAAAQRYVEGRLGTLVPSSGVVACQFGYLAATGAPAAGFTGTFPYLRRRNADGSMTDLIASTPAVVDRGDGLYEFTLSAALLPAGSQIRYIIDFGAAAASRVYGSIDSDEAVATPTDAITFGGAAWASMLDALREWVVTATGLANGNVIWADQTGPRPSPPFADLRLGAMMPVAAVDEVVDLYDAGRNAGSEIELRAIGLRQFYCTVRLFTSPVLDASSAQALLARAQLALSLPLISDALSAAGITVFDQGEVQNISALKDVKFEGRAMLEIGCYTIITASQFTTYIDIVGRPQSYMGPPESGTAAEIDIP